VLRTGAARGAGGCRGELPGRAVFFGRDDRSEDGGREVSELDIVGARNDTGETKASGSAGRVMGRTRIGVASVGQHRTEAVLPAEALKGRLQAFPAPSASA
jgi:hypothetical protein